MLRASCSLVAFGYCFGETLDVRVVEKNGCAQRRGMCIVKKIRKGLRFVTFIQKLLASKKVRQTLS